MNPLLELAALGCPDCPTSRLVRWSVFDERFASNLFVVALPILVVGIISTLLHRCLK